MVTMLKVTMEMKATRSVTVKALPRRKVKVTARFSPRMGDLVVCEMPDPCSKTESTKVFGYLHIC